MKYRKIENRKFQPSKFLQYLENNHNNQTYTFSLFTEGLAWGGKV